MAQGRTPRVLDKLRSLVALVFPPEIAVLKVIVKITGIHIPSL